MAKTLTTSWQEIYSETWAPGSGFQVKFILEAKYSTQSTANNTTTIQTRLRSDVLQGSGSGNNYRFACTYAPAVSGSGLWTFGDETITSGEGIVNHNADGTKTITLYASAKITTIGLNISFGQDVILPKIDRYPTLTTAPNFNDEENPTVTYSTISGFENATYSICIALAGSNNDDISYRNINLTDGSYTFNFTNAERTILRNSTPNSNTTTARFIIRTTTSGGQNYYSDITRTLTIVNNYPTFTHSEVETTQKVINVIGSSSASTVVQNASVVRMTITPTALKGSSIVSVNVSSGSNYSTTKTTSPYVFDIPILTNTINVLVIDSRGNATAEYVNKNMITYQNVDITSYNFERPNPTSSNIDVSFEARYYQITVGSTVNAPVVKWKLEESGTYATIPSSAYTIDTTNNKVTISSYQLTNVLSHENSGEFFIKIDDIFSEDEDKQIVNKGISTFEAGEFDLQVNGDLIIADTDGTNGVNVKNFFGEVLYENSTGVNTPVPLSKSLDNYSTIEVFTKDDYGSYINYNSIKAKVDVGNCLTIINATAHTGTQMIMEITRYTMNSNNLTRVYGISPRIATSGASLVQNSDRTKVIKVIGYK